MRLIFTFAFLFVSLCFAFDLSTLKAQFYDQVAPPYHSALSIIYEDIIQFLAEAPIPDNFTEALLIAQHLDSHVRLVSDHLTKASAASDGIRQQLDARVLQLISDGSKIESQIQQNQQQLDQVQARIGQTQAQIQDAQNQVGQGAASVQHEEQQVREEEDRVEKSRHCLGKRSWISKILGKVQGAVCSVLNNGGINRAKDAREAAQRRLAESRARLNQLQAQMANYQQQHAALVNGKSQLESVRVDLRNQLSSTGGERDRIVGINVELKQLIAHMGTLLGKSEVLTDVVAQLIDMETIIGPIQALGDQIVGYGGDGHRGELEQLVEIKKKIWENLPVVKEKLPLYALILDE